MPSCQCQGVEMMFDEETVRRDRLLYHRDGPERTTQWLIDALKTQGVDGLDLLDIGGGLGAIQHQLLDSGVSHATHVDASSAYLEGAKREAEERGLEDRIEWHYGNFVEIAPSLAPAEIVTLDRVICCYDDMPALVQRSAELATRYYGVVLPRDPWWIKFGARAANGFLRLFNNPYQMFIHSVAAVEDILAGRGFRRSFERSNLLWRVALYTKR